MKINVPIFKDEDAKDAITYQSWRWDLTVYHHGGMQELHPSFHMPSGPCKGTMEN